MKEKESCTGCNLIKTSTIRSKKNKLSVYGTLEKSWWEGVIMIQRAILSLPKLQILKMKFKLERESLQKIHLRRKIATIQKIQSTAEKFVKWRLWKTRVSCMQYAFIRNFVRFFTWTNKNS